MAKTNLLPVPQKIISIDGVLSLLPGKLILIESSPHENYLFTASRWQTALLKKSNLLWEITSSKAVPVEQVGLTMRVDPDLVPYRQGYELIIAPDWIRIVGSDEAGLFYGVCTLIQLLEQSVQREASILPCLRIIDHPDFPIRGIMLDISRDKVPTLRTVLDLVDRLAGWKINQLQLYTEHTFAYRNHPEPWAEASPFTGEDILELDAFCRQRYIDLVPNQNSFGHLQRWLKYPKYRPLAECPDGYDYPWGGHSDEAFTLCPTDPGSIQLIREMYDELLPHFSSDMLNVGCDETWDLGQGRSKELCKVKGTGRVYLEFLNKIYKEVCTRGKRMQFWGDIILQHPELVSELPKDVIALEWGYEANHPFDDHCAKFAAAGLEFYVCPGTSSWNSVAGRTDNALANLISAAENGIKHGATGYLNTDWGDNGHWQPLPVSYIGFAAGAAYSWSLDANRNLDIALAASLYGFDDLTGYMGKAAYDLGNVYKKIGKIPENASALFDALQKPLDKTRVNQETVTPESALLTMQSIKTGLSLLASSGSNRPDAGLLIQELQFAAHVLQHACQRILYISGASEKSSAELRSDVDDIIREHGKVWLARNRPGGLKESIARFQKIKEDYI